MHRMIRTSLRMQKHKFGISCHGDLFIETTPGPPEHENTTSMFHSLDAPECTMLPVDPTGCKNIISASRVPSHFLWNPHWAHPSMKNISLKFHASNAPECSTWPANRIGCKNTSSVPHVLVHFSYESVLGPPKHEK
jgi:hypothetical protein